MKNPKEGAAVDAIPAPTRTSKYDIDWDKHALMACATGKSILAGKNIRDTQIKSLRLRTREPFRGPTGHIEISMRNSSINPEDGVRYGDVYFSWIPNTTTNTKEG